MKLSPKNVRFCPGCPDSLSLSAAPQLIIKVDQAQDDTKRVSMLSAKKPKSYSTGLF